MSVIICCYNSEKRLSETLNHLALQQVPKSVEWEVILVDNASTDRTAATAMYLWERFEIPNSTFRILEEPRLGKNFAFEKAVRAAQHDYVLTCDDDNWLAQDYIARAHAIMVSDVRIGALGGCGIFKPEEPSNPEIADLSNQYVNGPQNDSEIKHWVYGAGSVYRRSAFIALIEGGWQQITTGRKGRSLICGEDVEICMMLYLTGYKIIASNNLLFHHFVPHKRQRLKYLKELSYWLSYSDILLINYHLQLANDTRPIAPMLNGWVRNLTCDLIKQILFMPIRKLKQNNNEWLKSQFAFMSLYGRFRGLVENKSRLIKHHKLLKQFLTLHSAK
ncbi:glycosyltransferase [Mucilaginibacter aquaedulcis]|uniref:glycosyltransferase n=1 Tax=Mucilaginibacter aquaedulcis TaxID=1187081 RepID=UPI0025B49045|nr:glycosyltransferase [Mucilaginibacter aquaedulcis]MDN3548726.1 glycosyltransferase [Mucilaginibacter aquaedulcis]